MSLTGSGADDPQRVGVPIADLLAGCTARTASSPRCSNGSGPTAARWFAPRSWHRSWGPFQGTRRTVAGEVGLAQGNHHPSICPYGLFRCADGLVQIAVGRDRLWRSFCAEFDLDSDADGGWAATPRGPPPVTSWPRRSSRRSPASRSSTCSPGWPPP
jgi:crotonobetainyl-CoA:carnitine CoA-transferase CaiB-like acyl-CoA transferase